MAIVDVLPYELYSDAPGVLLNKPEWEKANAAHSASFDFGSIPEGWPANFTGSEVWTGDFLKENRGLSEEEISEIDSAMKEWKTSSLPVTEMSRETFPLAKVGQILRKLSYNIYHGTGVQILRGFPIQDYTKEEQVIAFLGINSWIGDRRLNQGANRGICHIKSITHLDPTGRGKIYVSAQDNDAQMYHSDAGSNVVGLMAISLSGTGGTSLVASGGQIYNNLALYRPDILRILAGKKFRWRANGIPDEGVNLIHSKDGRLFLNFSTRTFIGYGELPERDSDYPALTFKEREAFGGWQWVADEVCLKTELEVGDIEWVNNLHHQYGRYGFSKDITSPRHLLRVWLQDSEYSPDLPSDLKNKFEAMFKDDPDFYPFDEVEEDRKRRETGIFTGSCKVETAEERLVSGGIGADNSQLIR